MKRALIVMMAVLALFALVAVSSNTAQAGTGAWCTADPEVLAIGDSASIACYGFSPNTHVWAYEVQPDGSAAAISAMSYKTNEEGSIWYGFGTQDYGSSAVALGTWTLVVEELGPGHTVVARAESKVRVTGGKEGVSGAWLGTDAEKYEKGEWITITGSGFAPWEIVTLWWEYPNGDCSSFTFHDYYYNYPGERGYSSLYMQDVKANESGWISYSFYFNPSACEGKYRFVGRGNSSGWGAETWATLTGHKVEESAWLWADKDVVEGISDTVSFSGSGYWPGEHVTCWLRTPQNQVSSVWNWPDVKADSNGDIHVAIYTGSYYPPFMWYSEGALGNYAMTCRGDSSWATGIAEFRVTGGVVDP